MLLAIGAFLMQFMVQGAWGVIPVHLNELSPGHRPWNVSGRGLSVGKLLASVNATLQAGLATYYGGNYGLALAMVAGITAVVICGLTAVGGEARGRRLFSQGHGKPQSLEA